MNYRRLLIIAIAVLCGALSFWAVHRNLASEIKNLAHNALCVVELKEGNASVSVSFTTSQTVEQFHVGVCPQASHERLSVFLDGGDLFSYKGTTTKPERFTCGRNIPGGTYRVTLRQVTGTHGGIVVIADKAPAPTGVTGWQILSRSYVGLVVLSGLWAFVYRKSNNQWQRAISIVVFQNIVLGFIVIFVYLLFHEGGHALGEIAFGRYDFAQSDFWGIHGHPHSGGIGGPALEPWQQGIITGGGLIMPTVAGWALFVLWRVCIRRSRNPMVSLYFLATIGTSVFPYIITAGGSLLGVISDGHFDGFVACIPGPQWLIKTLPWGFLLVCILILWHIVPEFMKTWKAQVLRLQILQQPH